MPNCFSYLKHAGLKRFAFYLNTKFLGIPLFCQKHDAADCHYRGPLLLSTIYIHLSNVLPYVIPYVRDNTKEPECGFACVQKMKGYVLMTVSVLNKYL